MENPTTKKNKTAIRNNRKKGSVGQFLKDNVKSESDLEIVSDYFTNYVYQHLKAGLEDINKLTDKRIHVN